MKASELMIGDWVLDGNIYAQVTSITCDGNIETTHNEHSNIELIEPIELKRVHLTKNGFSAINAEDNEFVYRDGYVVKVMLEEYFVDAIFLSIEFAERNIWKEIKYVHELQQAMRIMGCEKEIKLQRYGKLQS